MLPYQVSQIPLNTTMELQLNYDGEISSCIGFMGNGRAESVEWLSFICSVITLTWTVPSTGWAVFLDLSYAGSC